MDSTNWRLNKQIKYHEKGVLSMTTIENNFTFVSCSDDRKVNLVNMKTF